MPQSHRDHESEVLIVISATAVFKSPFDDYLINKYDDDEPQRWRVPFRCFLGKSSLQRLQFDCQLFTLLSWRQMSKVLASFFRLLAPIINMSQFKYVVISCTDSCLQSTTRVILRTHGGLANHSFVFEALSSWNCLLHTHFLSKLKTYTF